MHSQKQNPLFDLDNILQGGRCPDVITPHGEILVSIELGVWVRLMGQILPVPIDFDRRRYRTLALPCECVILAP